MANTILTFHQAGNRSMERTSMPVVRLPDAVSEVIATGATSVQSTLSAFGIQGGDDTNDGGFVTIYSDANLWVVAGTDPIAAKPAAGALGDGFPVIAGTPVTFSLNNGDLVALIEWS